MYISIQTILIILFITSLMGYILTILKEKAYLKNNMIIIDRKAVTQQELNEADVKEFFLDGKKARSGDGIKIVTKEKEKYNGILIGAKKKDREIMIVTYSDQIKTFKIENIEKFKIVSKYGKFFI